MKKREIACVYVIEDGDRVKVGSSWEPEKRRAPPVHRRRCRNLTNAKENCRVVDLDMCHVSRNRPPHGWCSNDM